MRRELLLLIPLLVAACADDETAIRIFVFSDMDIGSEVDGVEFEMRRDGAQIWSGSRALEPGDDFPVEQSISPSSASDDIVEIRVTGTLSGRSLLQAERTRGFARGTVVDLRICLLRHCLESEEEDCSQGLCPYEMGDADGDVDADADEPGPADGGDDADDGGDASWDGDSDAGRDGDIDAEVDTEVDDGRICDESCLLSADGICQDGGEGAASTSCEYGTDCADCGRRAPPLCTDSCALSDNGACDDGGLRSVSRWCTLGEDCTDCGPRLPSLCNDTCPVALDGECHDGGRDADYRWCAYGTDCVDCGARAPGDCEPDCDYRDCGDDGCGGSCGECPGSEECAPGGACIEWARIEATTFWMGSPEDELGRAPVEHRRQVTLTRDYLLSPTEVGQRWFSAVMRRRSSTASTCSTCPVDSISWMMAAQFCNGLSVIDGLPRCFECTGRWPGMECNLSASYDSPYECEGYRLPTDAEWEHAARAGTTTATYNGDLEGAFLECEPENPALDSIAWFCGNASDPQAVASKAPNAFGLYDMLGNLYEHVHDRMGTVDTEPAVDPFGPEEGAVARVRGGTVGDPARNVRAASIAGMQRDAALTYGTLRPARTADR